MRQRLSSSTQAAMAEALSVALFRANSLGGSTSPGPTRPVTISRSPTECILCLEGPGFARDATIVYAAAHAYEEPLMDPTDQALQEAGVETPHPENEDLVSGRAIGTSSPDSRTTTSPRLFLTSPALRYSDDSKDRRLRPFPFSPLGELKGKKICQHLRPGLLALPQDPRSRNVEA